MKCILLVLLTPYIIIEVIFTFIFGKGIGSYSFSNSLLNFYETLGFSSYVSSIANYEEDTGRCHRFYKIAKKSYIKSHPKDAARGILGNRDC